MLQLSLASRLRRDARYPSNGGTTGLQGSYSCQDVEKVTSLGHSSTYLGPLFIFVVGLAALVFGRRDVS
jgi:hypothetical protein